MSYSYKIIRESDVSYLQSDLDVAGSNGWKLVTMVWDHDHSCFVATMMKDQQ